MQPIDPADKQQSERPDRCEASGRRSSLASWTLAPGSRLATSSATFFGVAR